MIGYLNSIKIGYCINMYINGQIINTYIMWMIQLSSSLSGLKLFINCYQKFANNNHITYNIEKSVILQIYSKSSHHNPIIHNPTDESWELIRT